METFYSSTPSSLSSKAGDGVFYYFTATHAMVEVPMQDGNRYLRYYLAPFGTACKTLLIAREDEFEILDAFLEHSPSAALVNQLFPHTTRLLRNTARRVTRRPFLLRIADPDGPDEKICVCALMIDAPYSEALVGQLSGRTDTSDAAIMIFNAVLAVMEDIAAVKERMRKYERNESMRKWDPWIKAASIALKCIGMCDVDGPDIQGIEVDVPDVDFDIDLDTDARMMPEFPSDGSAGFPGADISFLGNTWDTNASELIDMMHSYGIDLPSDVKRNTSSLADVVDRSVEGGLMSSDKISIRGAIQKALDSGKITQTQGDTLLSLLNRC